MASKKDKVFADFESDIITGLISGKPLSGTEGVLTDLIKHVIEKSMSAELGEHLKLEAERLDADGQTVNAHSPLIPKNAPVGLLHVGTLNDKLH